MRAHSGVTIIWTEISDIRSEAVKYRRQANHDPLTGLLNRRGFELGVGGHHMSTPDFDKAMLVQIDLDNFKRVNDMYGHDSGDRVLIHTAECLKRVLGTAALIARTGGDEFAALVFNRGTKFDVAAASDTLNKLVRANEFAPGEITGLGASVGAVPLAKRQGVSFNTLMIEADKELYAAKKIAKARALETPNRGSFGFYFQPIIAARSGEVVGFEALLRSRGDVRATKNAEQMVDELAKAKRLLEVERACFDDVAQAYHTLKAKTGRSFEFSINVGQQQWNDSGFVPWLDAQLHRLNMPQDKLRVELLEDTRFGRDVCQVRQNMQALAQLGIAVDLDDFGLSGAALDRLTLPSVGRVKIAREMVTKHWNDLNMRRIVESILSLSRAMGYPVVVEGIEEPWQRAAFEKAGCDFFQGYHFGRPMPLEELRNWSGLTPGGSKGTPVAATTRQATELVIQSQ